MKIRSSLNSYRSGILSFSTTCAAALCLLLTTPFVSAAPAEEPLFDVDVIGDIFGPEPISANYGNRDGRIVINYQNGNTVMHLPYFDDQFGGNGITCFGLPPRGALIIEPDGDDISKAILRYVIFGYAADGVTEITYKLELYGTFTTGWYYYSKKEGVTKVDGGDPLGIGETLSAHFTSWATTIEGGKGKGRNSQVPEGACLDSGTGIDVTMFATRIALP